MTSHLMDVGGRELSVVVSDSFWLRLRGLLFRPVLAADHAMLISPCNQIHTFGMRYPIDVVFLDKDGCVIKIFYSVPPNCIRRCGSASKVLELLAGSSDFFDIKVGDVLKEGIRDA